MNMADDADDLVTKQVKNRWRRTDVTVLGKIVGSVDGRLDEESMDKLLDGLKLDGYKLVAK